jgi:hypothetical protein
MTERCSVCGCPFKFPVIRDREGPLKERVVYLCRCPTPQTDVPQTATESSRNKPLPCKL